MNSDALAQLPPEMQARIAAIMSGQPADMTPHQAAITTPEPAPAPVAKAPSLMDHVIALRQEVAGLRQQVEASSQVTEAVGNAVGALYQMFQPTEHQGHAYEHAEPDYQDQQDY